MYSIKTDGLPYLASYEAALRHYESVTPLRGRKEDARPIGPRRKVSALIMKDGDDIIARLYHTDVLRYKPNGDIVLDVGGWHTRSTFDFAAAIGGIHLFDQGGRLFYRYWDGNIAKSVYLGPEGPYLFQRTDEGLRPAKPATYKVHNINRKAMKAARDIHKDFLGYMNRMCLLRKDQQLKVEEYVEMGLIDQQEYDNQIANQRYWVTFQLRDNAQDLFDMLGALSKSSDPADHYRAFLLVPLVLRNRHISMSTRVGEVIDINPNVWRRDFDGYLLLAYRDAVMDEVEVECGKATVDRYGWLY